MCIIIAIDYMFLWGVGIIPQAGPLQIRAYASYFDSVLPVVHTTKTCSQFLNYALKLEVSRFKMMMRLVHIEN